MDAKQIDVTCPCCSTRITIDVRTATVLRSARPAEVDPSGRTQLDEERWDAAARRVQARKGEASDRLEEGMAREREKERRLDDLFDQAKKKLRPAEDEPE